MKTKHHMAVGRPKTKESRRNFKFTKPVDDFLVNESHRTGRDMTAVIELTLLYLASLKPGARDALVSNIRREAA
jgi:hypothetical protein